MLDCSGRLDAAKIGNMKSKFALIFYASATAIALPGQTSRGVGSGLAFAPPSYATVVNPASVASAPSASLAASYRTEVRNPFISFVGSTGFVGIGAAYRQENRLNSGKKDATNDVMEAALGMRLLFLSLGGTARKVENQRSDFDASAMLDMGPFRIGAVLRDMDKGPDRIDGFLGIKLANLHLEFNAKKPKPFEGKYWLVDAGLAFVTPSFSLALGYDFSYYDNKANNGEVHGGLSIRILDNMFIEGMYRPFVQEWTTHDWLAGARLTF